MIAERVTGLSFAILRRISQENMALRGWNLVETHKQRLFAGLGYIARADRRDKASLEYKFWVWRQCGDGPGPC